MKKYFKATVIVRVDDGNDNDVPVLETNTDQDKKFLGDLKSCLEETLHLDLDNALEILPTDATVDCVEIDWDTLEIIE